MEQRFGGELTYKGRVYNVKPLSKGTAFTIRFSSKDKQSGDFNSAFLNVYYNGDAIIQEKEDYLIRGTIAVDAPFKMRDGTERPSQMKLFANYAEPMNLVGGKRNTIDRTQPQQSVANRGF